MDKPFRTVAVRAIGETETRPLDFGATPRSRMKEIIKLPYFRRMIRIWLKNGVKNKYTSAYRLRKIDMRFREGPLDDSEFLARRQQIAEQLLSYKVPMMRQKL